MLVIIAELEAITEKTQEIKEYISVYVSVSRFPESNVGMKSRC